MRPLRFFLLAALMAFTPRCAPAQTVNKNVTKASDGTNAITESLSFAAGKTLTLNGTLAGTPSGGTLDLSALSLTLPASFVTTAGSYADPAWLASLSATKLTTGTLAAARLPAFTGDVTTSAGSAVTTLAASGVTAGTYGSATQSAQITLDAKGRATAAANITITPALGSITGLGTGVATFLATPSSANLAAAVTDETGTGSVVFANSPTLVTPNIGAATATSITSPAATNLTLSGSGSASANIVLGYGGNGTVALTAGGPGAAITLSQGGADTIFITPSGSGSGSQIRIPSGGVSAPILGTQAGSGFWFPGGGAWAYSIGGGESMRLSGASNLLIGTTSDMAGYYGVKIAGTQAATNTTSGALQVPNGGISTGGAIYAGGALTLNTGSTNGTDFNLINTDTGGSSWSLGTAGSASGTGEPAGALYLYNGGTRFSVQKSTGVVKITNLAGTGSRNVVADANGNLSAPVSDELKKKNLRALPEKYGLAAVMALKPVVFQYRDEKAYGTQDYLGFGARATSAVLPEITGQMKDGTYYLNDEKLTAVLVKAVQQQQAQIAALAAEKTLPVTGVFAAMFLAFAALGVVIFFCLKNQTK